MGNFLDPTNVYDLRTEARFAMARIECHPKLSAHDKSAARAMFHFANPDGYTPFGDMELQGWAGIYFPAAMHTLDRIVATGHLHRLHRAGLYRIGPKPNLDLKRDRDFLDNARSTFAVWDALKRIREHTGENVNQCRPRWLYTNVMRHTRLASDAKASAIELFRDGYLTTLDVSDDPNPMLNFTIATPKQIREIGKSAYQARPGAKH